jgi:hypothetical protein
MLTKIRLGPESDIVKKTFLEWGELLQKQSKYEQAAKWYHQFIRLHSNCYYSFLCGDDIEKCLQCLFLKGDLLAYKSAHAIAKISGNSMENYYAL